MNNSILGAILAGTMLPLQAVINARLARPLGSPLWAAAISGAVTTVALVVIGLATFGLPRRETHADLPAWSWTGGLCGAVALSIMTATAPRLGAATMVALVITGQVMFSLVLDQFGLFGTPSYPISVRRVIAACLLLVGALLFVRKANP